MPDDVLLQSGPSFFLTFILILLRREVIIFIHLSELSSAKRFCLYLNSNYTLNAQLKRFI